MSNGMQDRIILVGWQPYSEIPDFLAASDICILPAYNNEIMRNIVPIKMYEYMAAGKPVIATALPGVMKEFGRENGVIYVENAGEVVQKAIEISHDGGLEHLGRVARHHVSRNDWTRITDEFEHMIKGALHAR